MRKLSEATGRVAGQNFSRKFVALGRILKFWTEIMGADLADKALPSRVMYRKPSGQKDSPRAVLEIAVSSAHATRLHYQKDLLLERMAQVFGERWITDIKFVPLPSERSDGGAGKRGKKSPAPLTETEKNHLSELLADVDDLEVRDRLYSLGVGVLGKYGS